MNNIFGRYVIQEDSEEIIFGKLYKAMDLEEDNLVFIQFIRRSNYINSKFLANLIDESMNLSQINSLHIAQILDLGSYYVGNEEIYYIVNEYFSGIELSKVVKGNYMDLNTIVKITKQILNSLDLSYKQNLYHGSLNEDNILVDENNNVKIYDFGITKANNGVNIRKDNNITFLSPHQININYTDKDSDFFSLGVILFNAIFKKMPFDIGKDEQDMLKLIDRGIDWNMIAVTDENKALVNIVKKLIRRTDKYKNIQEILIDLSQFMYVKADIKEINQEIILNKQHSDEVKQSGFIKKILILSFMLMILFAVSIKFQ